MLIKPGGVRLKPPVRSSALPMPTVETWPLAQQRFLPGEQVTSPLSEIRRLRVWGFLVDPNGIAPTEVQMARSLNTFNLAEVRNRR